MGFLSRFTAPAPRPTKVKRVELSKSSSAVLSNFMALPESHRPTFDVRATLEALDLKYGVQQATSHLVVEVDDYVECSTYFKNVSLEGCTCKWSYDEDGYAEEQYASTCAMPEYGAINAEVNEIHAALADRERALKARERAAVLAGVEYELASVEHLTASLRAERGIIESVTEELYSSR